MNMNAFYFFCINIPSNIWTLVYYKHGLSFSVQLLCYSCSE